MTFKEIYRQDKTRGIIGIILSILNGIMIMVNIARKAEGKKPL